MTDNGLTHKVHKSLPLVVRELDGLHHEKLRELVHGFARDNYGGYFVELHLYVATQLGENWVDVLVGVGRWWFVSTKSIPVLQKLYKGNVKNSTERQ